MGRFLKKNYFGRYPLLNILVSKAVFWTLRRRERQLLKKAKRRKRSPVTPKAREQEGKAKEVQELLEQGYERINLGGGNKSLQGFFNIDFVEHPELEAPEILADIRDLSFIPDDSIRQIHSNHLVEHLTQAEFEAQLEQYRRILKPEGIISIRCPNLLGVSYGFFFGHVPEDDRVGFLELGFPEKEDFQNPKDDWYVGDLYGFYHWANAYTGFEENQHFNRFTPSSMKGSLEENGLTPLKMSRPEAAQLVVIAQK